MRNSVSQCRYAPPNSYHLDATLLCLSMKRLPRQLQRFSVPSETKKASTPLRPKSPGGWLEMPIRFPSVGRFTGLGWPQIIWSRIDGRGLFTKPTDNHRSKLCQESTALRESALRFFIERRAALSVWFAQFRTFSEDVLPRTAPNRIDK
jgi:hypothetical protein